MAVLGQVHATFFTTHQMQEMFYMPDEIILARMMTALVLEFEKAMHYHDEGYESDNDYVLPPKVMRPIHIYSVFTTKASFDLTISPKPSAQSHPTLPDVPEAYHSEKGSACASSSRRHPYQQKMSPRMKKVSQLQT